MPRTALLLALALFGSFTAARAADPLVDFNREVRPILSNNCFQCHGPDAAQRKADLRLDTAAGVASVVKGKGDETELIKRVTAGPEDGQMPPKKTNKHLSAAEIATLKRWVAQGAPFAKHWSYIKPVRPPLPEVADKTWARTPIDRFILARLEKEGLRPQPEADRYALIRRVSIDLTGLPPTPAEVDTFVNDPAPDAYEKLVDRLLQKPAYGEHWARLWLDLARYADSAGYADDPPRKIWGYRDYVIRAFNDNKRFDRFTLEQIAGDMLPNPTQEQLIATAFHRNTPTNNEGGTNDEEFRNVAVVDRVNTTLAVWMGTSMACAQCHSHKYDPITQKEYFRFFAFLNNTEDADRNDEAPVLNIFTEEQKSQQVAWERRIAELEQTLKNISPEMKAAQAKWEATFPRELPWKSPTPTVQKTPKGQTVELSPEAGKLTGLRVSVPAGAGAFVLSKVQATLVPAKATGRVARYIRVELPGKSKILSLAEVQVFKGNENVALKGTATQSSTDFDGPAKLAIDGNTDGDYTKAKSTTHTAQSDNPWWEVDLSSPQPIDRIVVWNRTDGMVGTRLAGFRLVALNEKREVVWEQANNEAPATNKNFDLSGARMLSFLAASADLQRPGFEAPSLLDPKLPAGKGWSAEPGKAANLLLIPAVSEVPAGSKLLLTLEYPDGQRLNEVAVSITDHDQAGDFVRTPATVRAALSIPADKRSPEQVAAIADYYLTIAPETKAARAELANVKKQLTDLKPANSIPIYRELPEGKRRTTRIQFRGNFLDLGDIVTEGVPEVFHSLPRGAPLNRITLANWLIDAENPLTGRVVTNRYWEQIFGIGLVRSSEEFGSQGELPSHPELLDWLAVEYRENGWDTKALLKLIVTSAAYRQSAKVTPDLLEKDPENRLLSRGPRIRLTAEVIRDQALFAAGLLSDKMYGPSVRPARPTLGLSAAFGGSTDWTTSPGEDRFRRGVYTEIRRSNPYPSMLTFDAPNREVCTLRRTRTNTPLQALTTLNDPVYVEAAQGLARRMVSTGTTPADKVRFGIKLCLARPATDREVERLVKLYTEAKTDFAKNAEKAKTFATNPLGMPPAGTDLTDLAAWTMVANVLLNLDEMFMRR
jgi:mono/diheme cytochrome c family protein